MGKKKKIFIACDCAGIDLKKGIIQSWENHDYQMQDLGIYSDEKNDYVDIAELVVSQLLKECGFGVLICGTGIGVSIAANRCKKVRAALCRFPEEAELARNYSDANILCLGGYYTTTRLAIKCINKFINSPFDSKNKIFVEKMCKIF